MDPSMFLLTVILALRSGMALSFSGPSLRATTTSGGTRPVVACGSGGGYRSRSGRWNAPSSYRSTHSSSGTSPTSKQQRGGHVYVIPPLPPLFSSSSSSSPSPPNGDDTTASSHPPRATSNDAPLLRRRRAFLSKFASTTLLPMMLSTTTTTTTIFARPTSAYARGYPINEGGPIVYGSDDIMSPKEHGTTSMPVQEKLRFGVSRSLADKICCFNRHFAEMGGYFEGNTSFEMDVREIVARTGGPVTFYDSVTGRPLFKAPIDRSVDDFIAESKVHGWPSFRDSEVIWDNVRVLKSSGETVSTTGTHLGHNLPDGKGNRYCINLVSVAGNPV